MSIPLPLRIGPSTRQLFALYYAPRSSDTGRGVLFCNPFGQESIRCHRLYRVLADRLARAGIHVLRFDYFGTNDSDGLDHEATLQQWTNDILAANKELLQRSKVRSVSWFGLRLGGTIAALASGHSVIPPKKIVAWEPVLDGGVYIAELAAAHRAASRSAYGARWHIDQNLREMLISQSEEESLGFPLPLSLRSELHRIRPNALVNARAAVVEVFLGPNHTTQSVNELIKSGKGGITVSRLMESVAWASNETMNAAIVPNEALQRIATSLAAI